MTKAHKIIFIIVINLILINPINTGHLSKIFIQLSNTSVVFIYNIFENLFLPNPMELYLRVILKNSNSLVKQ